MPLPTIRLKPAHLLLTALVVLNLVLLVWRGIGSREEDSAVLGDASDARATDVHPPAQEGPQAATQQVLLLSERKSAPSAELQQDRELSQETGSGRQTRNEDVRACRAWGPFNDAAEAEAVAKDLALQVGDFRVVESEISAATDYLVYIEPGGNRETARRQLQELRSLDVESYIMSGRFNNALSVGVFSQESRAVKQQARVAAMGYPARIEALERTQRVYHLFARVPAEAVDLGGQNRPCSEIAEASQFL